MASSPDKDDPTPPSPGLVARIKDQFAKREFLRHFTTLISGTAVSQVLSIIGTIMVGRLFSDAQLGAYYTIMSISSAIIPLAALRYDMAIVLPKRANDARMLLRLATRINVGTAVVATIVLLILGDRIGAWLHLDQEYLWLLWLVGPITWLMAQVVILTYWLTRTKNFKTVAQNKMTNSVAIASTQIVSGLLRWGVPGLMLATVLGQGLTLVNLLRRTKGEFVIDGPHASFRELAREHRNMPLLNGPNALVDSARLQGVPLLISNRFGGDGLGPTGQFALAWRLLQAPISLINGAVSQIFFQKLSVTRRGAMFTLIWKTVLRSIALGVVPFTLIWVLSPWILPFVLGAQWTQAGQIARVLVPWLFLNFLTSPISTVFVVARRQGLLLAFAIFFAAVPLGLLWTTDTDIVSTLARVSWGMTAMLVGFIGLALFVARRYDHGIGGPSAEEEAAAESEAVTVATEQAEAETAVELGDEPGNTRPQDDSSAAQSG